MSVSQGRISDTISPRRRRNCDWPRSWALDARLDLDSAMPDSPERKRERTAERTAARVAALQAAGKTVQARKLTTRSSARKKSRSSGPAIAKANRQRGQRGRPMSPGEKVARNSRFEGETTPRGVFDMAEREGKNPQYVKDAEAETSGKGGLAGKAYDAAHFAISKVVECKIGEAAAALSWAKAAETLCKIAATAPASSGASAGTGKGRGRGSALQPPKPSPKLEGWKRNNPMYDSDGELKWPKPDDGEVEWPDDPEDDGQGQGKPH